MPLGPKGLSQKPGQTYKRKKEKLKKGQEKKERKKERKKDRKKENSYRRKRAFQSRLSFSKNRRKLKYFSRP